MLPLLAFPVLYPLIYYVTHSSLRYRHPIDPFLLLLTVLALRFVAGTRSSTDPPIPIYKTI